MISSRFVQGFGTDSLASGVTCSSTEPVAIPGLRPIATFPTFVINLERDVGRRRHMTGQLRAHGMSAAFVTAVDGRTLTDAERAACDRARALRIYGGAMTDNEIACYLSHLRLYERIVRQGIETALILEDDVRIDPSLPRVLDDIAACSFTHWLVIRLDSKRVKVVHPPSAKWRGTRVATLSGGAGLYRLRTHVLGTGGVLIRREGARRMLEYGQRIFMPIDQTMDRFWENGILPYAVRPFPVLQAEDFRSSTGVRPSGRRSAQPIAGRLRCRIQRISDGLRKRAFILAR
jgi:glycosyl transferase family 25